MAKRYIDAEKLKEYFFRPYSNEESYSNIDIRNIINEQPSADVRENVHGNWVGIDDEPCETFECDKCGFVLDDWIQGALYNFCPNCNADMRRQDGE